VELEGSLSCSQEPATCPYPEPDESNPHLSPLFHNIIFNIILPSMPKSSKCSECNIFFLYANGGNLQPVDRMWWAARKTFLDI
jgi:hypothetical protein